MKNQHRFNGDRLQKARVYNGLTVAELADKIDCQRQTVSMYENKKIETPDDKTVKKMSEILGFPVKYFYEEDCNVKIGSTYFRALLTTNKKYRKQQILKMEFISVICSFLMEYINFNEPNIPLLKNDIEPETAALELRKCWNLGLKPIENLVFEAEQNGIIVTSYDTEIDTIDAFSQMIDINSKSVYSVAYSSNKTSASRIHFDIAHELGHICLHEWSEDIESLTKDEFKEREKEANQFASAFLLPRDSFYYDVRQRPLSLPYYTELKKKWKVSIQAMIRRALSLEIISYEEYQVLMRTLQRRGMRKEEPLDDSLLTAKPSLLKSAVIMLLDEGVFTPREFMNELSFSYNLSLNSESVEHLLGLPNGTLRVNNVIPIHELKIIKG